MYALPPHLPLKVGMGSIEMILLLLSGAWGKVIHEKTWSKKSRDTVPVGKGAKYKIKLYIMAKKPQKVRKGTYKGLSEGVAELRVRSFSRPE